VNKQLQQIDDWETLAANVNWSISDLAKRCGVSTRTLHRYFVRRMGSSTKTWMAKQRQKQAVKLLAHGASIKETSASLGYSLPHNFARQYKSITGVCPSSWASNKPSPRSLDRK